MRQLIRHARLISGFCSSGYDFAILSSRLYLTIQTLGVAVGFVGNYAPCGLSPQTDGMPVIRKKKPPGKNPRRPSAVKKRSEIILPREHTEQTVWSDICISPLRSLLPSRTAYPLLPDSSEPERCNEPRPLRIPCNLQPEPWNPE